VRKKQKKIFFKISFSVIQMNNKYFSAFDILSYLGHKHNVSAFFAFLGCITNIIYQENTEGHEIVKVLVYCFLGNFFFYV